MLKSIYWRIRNFIGSFFPKSMPKEKIPGAFENIQPDFNHGFLKSQCTISIPHKIIERCLRVLSREIVSVIVPVYNAYDETKNCIESIIKYTTIPFDLVLVNDSSTDIRINKLFEQYQDIPFVQIISNFENLGFVKSVNIGMKSAKGDVVLLNSDTKVTSRWLQKLILAAYSDNKTATVTPFSNASGAFSVPDIGQNKEIAHNLTLCSIAHIVERVSCLSYPRVPTGNGFCMYIKRQVIDEIGLFDHVNFKKGYGEENDFCMRANKKGWHHIIDDSSFIYHKNSASFSSDKDKLIRENRKVLNKLHPEYTNLIRKFLSSETINNIRENIRVAIKNGSNDKRHDSFRILYVMQEELGSIFTTDHNLVKSISAEHECFLLTSTQTHLRLRYIEKNRITLLFKYELPGQRSISNFKFQESRNFYFSLLVNLKIEMVHSIHLLKDSFELSYLCRLLGLGYIFSFCDFFHINSANLFLSYQNAMMPVTTRIQHKTIALFTPHGAGGFPGSSYVRCLVPLKHPEFCKRFSLKIVSCDIDKFIEIEVINERSVNYVLVQRDALTCDDAEKIISWCNKNSIPLVYEIDDNLLGIDSSHPDYYIYEPKIEAVEKLCQSARLIIVSTPELKNSLVNYSSNIKVIDNALDENLWFSSIPCFKKDTGKNVINVGYMGTYTHIGDLSLLKEVILEVKDILKQEYGITMKFFMVGGQKDKLIGRSWYTRINIPAAESIYPNFVKWLRQNIFWDIALAPLENNLLNKSKSALKFFEYTALGAAGIYSDQGGYSHTIVHRKNGFLVKSNSMRKWKAYLIELSLNKMLRQKIVTQAKDELIANHLLKQRVSEWISAFDNIHTDPIQSYYD